MKKTLILAAFFTSINFGISQNMNLDQDLDKSLDQIESFLDTFSLDQIFSNFLGGTLKDRMPNEGELDEITSQMKIGIEQMKAFDMSIFQGFIQEFEKMVPEMQKSMPNFPMQPNIPNKPNLPKAPRNERDKPVKKI